MLERLLHRNHSFNIEGKSYSVPPRGSKRETRRWFEQYLKEGPKCANCKTVLLPGQEVFVNGVVTCLTFECCPLENPRLGMINSEGKVI